jgi:glycosyltransferase involved in cell wall biosynthesis
MHVMYVHQNFPAQFGHIAAHLARTLRWKCTFVTQAPAGTSEGIERIQYKLAGGATKTTHFCSRTFENTVWHCDGVYRALRERKDVKPDLVVGHSGFGSTLFLRELYPDVPVINFFEYFYHPHDPDSDMDFRSDLGWEIAEVKYLRSRCRNSMIMLDLLNCQIGYTPTRFQGSKLPAEFQYKIRTIFDGVDRKVYHGHDEQLRPPVVQRIARKIAGVDVAPGTRLVTYVSRGFESMRGFDIFMRSAKLIYQQYPDVVFIVIGTDRIAYGGDDGYTGGKSFKDWVLSQDTYDLEKIRFVGRVNPLDLAKILASSDLHIYLTVPFVLSWSMMDAMSCGAVVLGSATSPVKEMIRDGENGLLADFFKPDEFAAQAVKVLQNPDEFRPLGRAAERMITEQYSLEAVLPQMLQMYEDARQLPTEPPREPRPAPVVPPRPFPPSAGPAVVARAKPTGRSPFRG